MAIVLREEVHVDRCKYLLENFTFAEHLALCDDRLTAADAKREYNKIKKYLMSKIMGDIEIKYNFSRGRKDGRMYGKNSIQTLWKNMRGFICDGITTDIDFESMHPVLLYNICINNNIECPNLTEYVKDRERCLKKIMEADKVSRADAKNKIFERINYNKCKKSSCDYLRNFDRETLHIQRKCVDLEQYSYLKPFAKKERNFEGSFMNLLLGVEENKLLMMVKKCCDDAGIKIHAFMFDGLMVYGDITEGFLKSIKDYVINQSGFECINITIKPHKTDFEMPADWEAPVYTTYEDIKADFNKHNCKVGEQFVHFTDTEIFEYSRSGFQTFHEELKYFDPDAKGNNHDDKMVSFTKKWFEDPDKKKYLRMDSYPKPDLCPNNVLNIWRPYPVEVIAESIDKDKCEKGLQFFKNHIDILCNHQQEVTDFVNLWISQMFQYPENKSCELVFISFEGAGKGCLLDFFKTIMGHQKVWECTDPQRDIFGSFNGKMRESMLVVFQEANKSVFFNANDKKKALITDNVITINQKGVKQYDMKSYHRFITFTNNACPCVPNKRRDCIIRASDEMIDNIPYFTEGFKYAQDVGVCKYIYDHYMKQQTQPRITAVDIPITDYHKEMVVAHKPLMRMFLEDLAEKARNNELEPGAISEKVGIYTSDELYRMFVSYAALEKQSTNEITKSNFSVKFSHHSQQKGGKQIEKKVKKINGKTYNMYIFDLDAFVKQFTNDDTGNEMTDDELSDDDSAVVEAAAAVAAAV